MNQIPLTEEHLRRFRSTQPFAEFKVEGKKLTGMVRRFEVDEEQLTVVLKWSILDGIIGFKKTMTFNRPMVDIGTCDGDTLIIICENNQLVGITNLATYKCTVEKDRRAIEKKKPNK